jgi:transposase-like protein
MREADFEVLLHLVERLGGEQRAALGRALASASGEPEAVRLLEEAFAAAPRCPHCAAARLQRWGHASGLRRYRCAACRKTFNALPAPRWRGCARRPAGCATARRSRPA